MTKYSVYFILSLRNLQSHIKKCFLGYVFYQPPISEFTIQYTTIDFALETLFSYVYGVLHTILISLITFFDFKISCYPPF